jgi:hypothetical protein
MLKSVPPNVLGCTHIGEWSTSDAGPSLEEQLHAAVS